MYIRLCQISMKHHLKSHSLCGSKMKEMKQNASKTDENDVAAIADQLITPSENVTKSESIAVINFRLPSAEKARSELINFVLTSYAILSTEAFRTCKLLFSAVIADFIILNGIDAEITARVAEITEFLNRINALEMKDSTEFLTEKLQFIMDWERLMEKFDVSIKEQPNTLDLVFDISFQKNGAEILSLEFGERLLKFMQDLDKALHDFWSSLTNWEQINEVRFGAWYWQYRTQWCIKRKFLLLNRLFQMYDELNVGNNENNVKEM